MIFIASFYFGTSALYYCHLATENTVTRVERLLC